MLGKRLKAFAQKLGTVRTFDGFTIDFGKAIIKEIFVEQNFRREKFSSLSQNFENFYRYIIKGNHGKRLLSSKT